MLGTSGWSNSMPSLPILGAAFIGGLSTDSLGLPFVLLLSKLLPVVHFSPFNGNRSVHLFWVNDKIAFMKFMQIKLTELAHLKTFSSY